MFAISPRSKYTLNTLGNELFESGGRVLPAGMFTAVNPPMLRNCPGFSDYA